jgi:glycosyltransferase involved in cell wall biosynthesis
VKILFDHSNPFCLAHGGYQVQIQQTRLGLLECGLEVEFLEWWNPRQKGDILHYFGRPGVEYIRLAHTQGMKLVLEDLLTAPGSRSRLHLGWQRFCIKLLESFLPASFTIRMAWESYRLADACIANTPWEAHLMNYLFGADQGRVHVVPNGVESVFLQSRPQTRGPWLVCTATITERKRVLELAQAAVLAQTPLWIIGRPYSDADPYAQQFFALAKQYHETIRYEGQIGERAVLADVYRAARGFVLLSLMETRSLAAEEAAACECPLLLSDLPWARATYGSSATYCPVAKSAGQIAGALRAFYAAAPLLPAPPKPAAWRDVGLQFKKIYEELLKTSR